MTTALLCETVTGHTMAELLAARDSATHGDMVELRLDGVAGSRRRRCAAGPSRPGSRDVPSHVGRWPLRRQRGAAGARPGARARARRGVRGRRMARGLTVERRDFAGIVARDPARVVVSSHDFDGVPRGSRRSRPSDARRRRRVDQGGGGRLASDRDAGTEANRRRGRRDRDRHGRGRRPVAAAGHAVRIALDVCRPRGGSGQLPAETMADDYHFFRVEPETRIYGVVSTNAMHSLSPVMHNAAFEAAGIDAVYVPLRAADFDDFLSYAAAMGIEGASITIPFKLDALRAASQADALTQSVGAANTLRRRDRGVGGHEYRRGRLPVAARRGLRRASERRSRRGARRRRRGARGRGRAAVARRDSSPSTRDAPSRRESWPQSLDGRPLASGRLGPDPGTCS